MYNVHVQNLRRAGLSIWRTHLDFWTHRREAGGRVSQIFIPPFYDFKCCTLWSSKQQESCFTQIFSQWPLILLIFAISNRQYAISFCIFPIPMVFWPHLSWYDKSLPHAKHCSFICDMSSWQICSLLRLLWTICTFHEIRSGAYVISTIIIKMMTIIINMMTRSINMMETC